MTQDWVSLLQRLCVGYWTFEADGTDSTGRNTLTETGSGTGVSYATTGIRGHCATFTQGPNKWLQNADAKLPLGRYSFVCWTNFASHVADRGIFGPYGASGWLFYEGAGVISNGAYPPEGDATLAYPTTGAWAMWYGYFTGTKLGLARFDAANPNGVAATEVAYAAVTPNASLHAGNYLSRQCVGASLDETAIFSGPIHGGSPVGAPGPLYLYNGGVGRTWVSGQIV